MRRVMTRAVVAAVAAVGVVAGAADAVAESGLPLEQSTDTAQIARPTAGGGLGDVLASLSSSISYCPGYPPGTHIGC
ncbi:hypothetical protein ACW9HQ_51375 [Nocardia gipuzkoensis]